MIVENDKWQKVREKQEELRMLVDENWEKGEWGLAVLGERIIKTVEESKASAAKMRQHTDNYLETVEKYHRMVNNAE